MKHILITIDGNGEEDESLLAETILQRLRRLREKRELLDPRYMTGDSSHARAYDDALVSIAITNRGFTTYDPSRPFVIVRKDYEEGSRAMWREYERFEMRAEARAALQVIHDNLSTYEDRTGYETMAAYKIVEDTSAAAHAINIINSEGEVESS